MAKAAVKQVEAKLSRRGKEILNEDDEIKKFKKESDSGGIRNEQAEERTFVPSAVSVPLKNLFRCDNQCSEKTLSCWQLASVVLNVGDEAYTTNLCQKCFHKHLQAKRKKPLTNIQWREVVEKKAYRGRMWKMMGKNHMCVGCGNISPVKDRRRRSFDSWLTKRSRQKYKVNGSRNRQQENTWSK